MADLRKFGNTSNLVRFILKNSSTGVGLTGLTFSSSGLIISTIADDEATATAYTAAGSTIETISTLGTFAAPTATKCRFKEVDATNHKGLYEFQFADARFAVTSARRMVISVTGAANLLDADYEIQLTQFDPYDSVRLGLTSLPNAAANANGGLPILSSSGTALAYTVSTVTNLTNLPAITTDWLTGTGVAASAVTKIQAGLSTYAGGDTGGTTTLLSRLTSTRAGLLDNLDAAISTRSTYAGGDTSGTTTLLSRLTSGRTDNLDNLDATVSSRLAASSYAPLGAAGIRSALGLAAANLDTQLAGIDADVLTRLAASGYTAPLTASGVRTAIGLSTPNLDTQLSTIAGYVDTEVSAIKAKTDALPASPAATSDIPSAASVASAVLTTQMTESYNADGAAPTLAQALFVVMQRLTDFTISGTSITVKKINGSTTAYVLTMDSATTPTSSTRSS